MLESLMQRWQAMALRERRLVLVAGVFVLSAIVYLLLIEPAWLGRQRLQRELPTLRAQLARIDQLADEARQLGSAPAGADTPQAVRARLEQSIDAAGLRPALAQLQQTGSLFDVRFRGVPHAAWLAWIDVAVRDTRLRVVDVSVTRESSPGLVTARASLELPRREGR
ncbi:type II secretion system protein M [Burkholderiaceae bacterium FT117]|uniref:type II secretion system protein M n=1 Tax=Zeimonas sediminis TaxID=2944268 RepID=UPI00234322F4|nr:type II secretion system protein M [Zeimonas sediminis]MCM5569639.1 type II secretion system protein M [Zeimonas sediminis]